MAVKLSKKISIEKVDKSLPIYQQVRQGIRNAIESEYFKPGEALPSVSGLVRELKVNHRTIKQAFDLLEKDGIIRQEPWKGAVVSTASEKAYSIIFIRWCGDPINVALCEGIQRFLKDIGMEVIIVDASTNHENYLNAIMYPPEGTDGLILLPFDTSEYVNAIREAQKKGLKIVFVDRLISNLSVSSVTADHFTGAYQAVTHLIETHNRPVYYLGYKDNPSSCREWYRGWLAAMHEHNYDETDPYLFTLEAPETETSVNPQMNWWEPFQTAKRLFETRHEEKYSIFSNDYMAKGIYKAASEKDLIIGKDVFVFGFGDYPFASKLPVSLSSVFQNTQEVGFEAAKLLYQILSGDVQKPICKVVPIELRVRDSSMKPYRGDQR